jgi:hypothetical protein
VKIAALALALLAPLAVDAQAIKLVNPGFEQKPKDGEVIPGWRGHQHAGDPSYEFALDTEIVAKGKNSFRIKRILPQDYGALDQIIPSRDLIGKDIEFSALVRTADVGKYGFVLCINIIDSTGSIRTQIRSQPRTTGTVDEWTRLTARTKVPSSGVREVEVGFLLMDGGTAWVDEAALKIVPPEGLPGDKTKADEKTVTKAKPPEPEKPAKTDRKAKDAKKAAEAKPKDE